MIIYIDVSQEALLQFTTSTGLLLRTLIRITIVQKPYYLLYIPALVT